MKKGIFIIVVLTVVLTAFGAEGLWAFQRVLKDRILEDRNAQWQITANKMSYDEKEGLFVAHGDVAITKNGQVLSARMAKYNEKTGIVEVTGDVRLETNGDFINGERGIFDLNNYTGQITKGRLFLRENHYYVNGEALEKLGPDTYRVKGCRLTTCDGENPAWSISGSEVKVTIEGYGTVKDAVFRIRDVPVFYVPYGLFPAKTQRQTGLLPPAVGYSNRNGAETELPFFWAISDQVDATFYERYMGKRGLMQGVESRYVAEKDSKGEFLFDVLSDSKETKDLSDPKEADISPYERANKTRYWMRSRTDQQLPMGVKARLDTDYVSDQDYLKEFSRGLFGYKGRPDLQRDFGRPIEEVHSPTRRSALRLDRDGAGYSLQAQSAYHQQPKNLPNDQTPQPLGGLNYALMPRQHLFGSPLAFRFGTDYDYVWREAGQKGQRFSLGPELSYPMWLSPFLEFEPSVSFTRNTQWLDRSEGGLEDQSRDAYEMQARLSTVLERIFDADWGDVKKLKHKFSPSLTYRYRGYNDPQKYRPWFEKYPWSQAYPSSGNNDPQKYRPWFETLDAEGKANVLTLSLYNYLDAREENEKGEITYAQWGTFGLSQGYDIAEAGRDEKTWGEKKPFEPLVGTMTYFITPKLDIDTEVWWDHYDEGVTYADLALELSMDRAGGKTDRYAVEHQYLRDGNRSLGYRAHVNLLEGFSAGISQHRNLNLRYNVGSSYYLEYRSQCWGVRLINESLDSISSFMVTFSLLGLGDVGRW